jgi:hypothetical protein
MNFSESETKKREVNSKKLCNHRRRLPEKKAANVFF